jgi:hypothetical protein
MRLLATGFAVLTLVAACGGSRSEPGARPDSESKDQYLITAKELDAVNRDNLYDAVRQLRPGWLTRRTRQQSGESAIIVYLDDRQFGTVAQLRQVSSRAVQSVRYLGPTEAQVRYGQMNGGRPAILLESVRSP